MRKYVWGYMALCAAAAVTLTAAVSAAFGGGVSAAAIAVAAVVMLILSGGFSKGLTDKIAANVNAADTDSDGQSGVFEEFSPLMRRLRSREAKFKARLTESERRADNIEFITDNMREGVLLLDGKGTILLANRSVTRTLGVHYAEGKAAVELCREATFVEALHGCLSGAEREIAINRDGKSHAVLFSPTPPAGAVVLFIDLTDKFAAERQRREFSANVSHELKTPLTTISALAEMMAGGAVKPEDVTTFAKKIQSNASRLVAVVEDVIRLSEFDEGNADRTFERFDVKAVAESVAEALTEKARAKAVTIAVEGETLFINANKRMIDELIYNLTDNAIKYNKDGGNVKVALSKADGLARIAVSDTGIGVPDEHIPRLFDRFYRVDPSRSKTTGGTGLGLAIVKHIAEFHGGQARMESVFGDGTTVTCEIPAKE